MTSRYTPPADSSTVRVQTYSGEQRDGIKASALRVVTVRLLFENDAWRITVERENSCLALPGVAELIAYIEHLALETSGAVRRGLR